MRKTIYKKKRLAISAAQLSSFTMLGVISSSRPIINNFKFSIRKKKGKRREVEKKKQTIKGCRSWGMIPL
jgi:hypothetical protein